MEKPEGTPNYHRTFEGPVHQSPSPVGPIQILRRSLEMIGVTLCDSLTISNTRKSLS